MTILSPSDRGFSADAPLGTVLRHPQARELLREHLPELRDPAMQMILGGRSVGLVIATSESLSGDPTAAARLLEALSDIAPEAVVAAEPVPRAIPDPHFEDASVGRGSAAARWNDDIARFGRFELVLEGPGHGNPFVDVALRAVIETPDGEVDVPGFYDGDGVYRLRYLVEHLGAHRFRTRSTARSLDGIEGGFRVVGARDGEHGPVHVERTFHFAHADGTRYLPIGTTVYAWTHQGDELEERTLRTLASAPFTKVRMCVFPKSYLFNQNEPERFPFPGDLAHGFDLERFDIDSWRHLEARIAELGELGIEADVILFHPYDRWGFATMDPEVDDFYLRYAVARLASFPNVWWSLANEYDLMTAKTVDDWERFAAIVQADDPTRHLLSIHNCFGFYDHSRPWVTHASLQRQDLYKTAEMTTEWRERWGKPVVIDECAYEGDIDQGWGNITAQEMVRRFWEGAVRGGYVGHGETYLRSDEVLWWAKGGELHGESAPRIGFLRTVLEEAPREIEPVAVDWDIPSAGVEGRYYLFYYGFTQPRFRRFLWDPAVAYEVDLIDTWNMTVETLPGVVRGRFTIDLPGRPYLALRFRAVPD
jgi:hypothetical protein